MYPDIEAEEQVFTCDRRADVEMRCELALFFHRPAGGVDQDFTRTAFAVQLRLVGTLDAELADEAGARIFVAVDALQVLFVDGADVADGVDRGGPEGIVAGEARADVDAGELITVDREDRHLLLVELQLDGHALVHLVQHHGAPDIGDLLRPEQADAHQLCERRIQRLAVADLFADQFYLERGQIVGEYDAVPVEDQAAARRNRLGADAVALGQRGVVIVPEDLQVEQPRADHHQHAGGQHARDDAADREQAVFREVILDPALAAFHHRGALGWGTSRE